MTNKQALEILKGLAVPIHAEPAFDMAIQTLEQTRWIPVSERLPEEHICDDGYVEPSKDVLVVTDHNEYAVSRYWGNRQSKKDDPNRYSDWVDVKLVGSNVIAWMPLPQPYRNRR